MQNVGNLFRPHVISGRIAFVDLSDPGAPVEISFEDFDAACNAVARGLRQRGLGMGDRIAIVSPNRGAYLATLFGAMRAGCVPVPVNIRLAWDSIRSVVASCGARLVFADSAFASKLEVDLPLIEYDSDGGSGFASFCIPGDFTAIDVKADTVAIQPYTSGSTGIPKGVCLSHAGIRWVTMAAVATRKMGADICTLVAAPLYHKNALQAIKQTLLAGGRFVLMKRFDARAYIKAIEDYRCTLLTGVPTMLALMLREKNELAQHDVSSVNRIGFGSAPASDALYDQLQETFPDAVIENHYGITEGGPIMFGPHPDGVARPRNSIGFPLQGADIKLVGEKAPGEGVLHVRSPGVMLGYHNQPEATETRMKDGFFDTGDILRLGEDGFYYFVGRSDDMFVTSGENIYPIEVESMLETHPEIEEATVVAVEDDIRGHVPHAFVVRAANSALDEEAIKQFALEHGPPYAHPRRIYFVPALPLTGTNKIDRQALTALANAGRQEAKDAR